MTYKEVKKRFNAGEPIIIEDVIPNFWDFNTDTKKEEVKWSHIKKLRLDFKIRKFIGGKVYFIQKEPKK